MNQAEEWMQSGRSLMTWTVKLMAAPLTSMGKRLISELAEAAVGLGGGDARDMAGRCVYRDRPVAVAATRMPTSRVRHSPPDGTTNASPDAAQRNAVAIARMDLIVRVGW